MTRRLFPGNNERLVVVHDIWTEASILAAVFVTALAIGFFFGKAAAPGPLERCIAGDIPRATCEYLFDEGAGQ